MNELFQPWKKLEWRLKQTARFLQENKLQFPDKERVQVLDKNLRKAQAKVARLQDCVKTNDVKSLKEATMVRQKYFDKTIGEYKALAKARDAAKRKSA